MTDQVAVLESIRDVLSGKGLGKKLPEKESTAAEVDEEILDLTRMLNDDGSVTDLAEEKTEATTENTESKDEDMGETSTTKGDDVLSEIDKLLANDGDKEEAASEQINPDDLDAMFDSAEKEEKPAKEPEEEHLESITDDSVELELAEANKQKPQQESDEEVMTEETEKTEATEENLISDESADKAKSAISDLLKVTGKNEKPAKPSTPSPSFRNGDTVEDLVMESLKPMLAKWLDENLSSLVEEIVQKEISRIIPK